VEQNYSLAPQAEVANSVRQPSQLQIFKQVQSLYIKQFGRWFGITAPTSVMAAVVLVFADQQIRAISRTIPKWTEPRHPVQMAELFLLRFGGYFVAWLLGCFALGAIATVINGLDDDQEDFALRDSHHRARERFGPLFSIAVITFLAFLIGIAASQIVVSAMIKIFGWSLFLRFSFAVELTLCAVTASIVSWLGMAVPLVLRRNVGVRSSLRKSLEAADGNQGFLLLLVLESLAGSYIAWYATHYCSRLLVPDAVRYTAWYGWVVLAVAVLASAAVEPPIFIGFSLLADPERLSAASPSRGPS
jgi:hypothetical protein